MRFTILILTILVDGSTIMSGLLLILDFSIGKHSIHCLDFSSNSFSILSASGLTFNAILLSNPTGFF